MDGPWNVSTEFVTTTATKKGTILRIEFSTEEA